MVLLKLKIFQIKRATLDEIVESFNSLDDLNNLPSYFRYDPSIFAKMIDPNKVLMINAIFDPFIPRKS